MWSFKFGAQSSKTKNSWGKVYKKIYLELFTVQLPPLPLPLQSYRIFFINNYFICMQRVDFCMTSLLTSKIKTRHMIYTTFKTKKIKLPQTQQQMKIL